MKPPSYTVDGDRLAALQSYDILDTATEPAFDDIVELAAHICHAPVALVSFVAQDRQWFKARLGFDPCETDIRSSVCAHALVEPDLLVIPDLTADPRSRDNPLVTSAPHIRFYAGAPLRTSDGHVLGSLCVLDAKPRPGGLTSQQCQMLRALARQVMTQLDLRLALKRRHEAEQQRIKAEAAQKMLNHELSHRMKNSFAMVQAIASQTLRPVRDQGPVEAFGQRLHALSVAHDLLLQQDWTAAGMEGVVRAVLQTVAPINRFDITGPAIELGPQATLSVSLLMYELTANATKYGALSDERGRVSVDWRIQNANGERQLALAWTEMGGPPVQPPDRTGFGSRLIKLGINGSGEAQLNYPASGFQAAFTAPLALVQGDQPTEFAG